MGDTPHCSTYRGFNFITSLMSLRGLLQKGEAIQCGMRLLCLLLTRLGVSARNDEVRGKCINNYMKDNTILTSSGQGLNIAPVIDRGNPFD